MNVVLVTSDTTAAHFLPPYGDNLTNMPGLTGIARTGTVFLHYSAAVQTIPCHASIFTGLYPDRHRVLNNIRKLPPEFPTLAGILAAEGYLTAAITCVVTLENVARGFQEISLPVNETGVRPSTEILPEVSAYLAKRKQDKEPFFLWIHSFDPHLPYLPPPPFNIMHTDGVRSAYQFTANDNNTIPGYTPWVPADYAGSQYRGELASWDRVLEKIFNDVREMRNTLCIFTADHGENVGEGQQFGHQYVTEEVLGIPCIFWHQNKHIVPAGRVIHDFATQQVDLLPTVLSLLNLSNPIEHEGSDISPLLRDGRMESRPAYALSRNAHAAVAIDPGTGVKVRQRLVHRTNHRLQPPPTFPQFTDSIISNNGIFPVTFDSRMRFRQDYEGQVTIPDVARVESLEYSHDAFGALKLTLTCMEVKDGKFSAGGEAYSNCAQVYGENCPFDMAVTDDCGYSLRFLSAHGTLLWQSPWLPYLVADTSGNTSLITYEAGCTVIELLHPDHDGRPGVEFGDPYTAGADPGIDRIKAGLEQMLHRPGSLMAEPVTEMVNDSFFLGKRTLMSPQEAYHIVTGMQSESERDLDEDVEEALRSLGYIK
ncbi:sulfatase [bacterium]|nr:sulfatase [candidate division CSSED10-310 bacterium]